MQGAAYSSDADEDYSDDSYSGSDDAPRSGRTHQQHLYDRATDVDGGGGGGGGGRHQQGLPPYGADVSMLYHNDSAPEDDGEDDDDEMFEDGAGGGMGLGGDGGGGGGFAEVVDEDYEPTDQEIQEYCEWLNLDIVSERSLIWIAREALKAPLPENWKMCYTEDREIYYFNMRTGESIWDHPMDAFYKSLYREEKTKLDKKKKSMRLFTGGNVEVKPMSEFFSEISETCGFGNDAFAAALAGPTTSSAPSVPPASGGGGGGGSAQQQQQQQPWLTVPETLIDPIDMRIFVDPVVLPTSGRTVSRHTIISNKWRDPFSREYIENRRLVPNVDKRGEVDRWLQKMAESYFESINNKKVCETVAEGFRRLLILLPFMIDKDQEVCVWSQTYMLKWFQTYLAQAVTQQQQQQDQLQQQTSVTVSPALTPRGVCDENLPPGNQALASSTRKPSVGGGAAALSGSVRKDALLSEKRQSTINKKLHQSIAVGRNGNGGGTGSSSTAKASGVTTSPGSTAAAFPQLVVAPMPPPPHLIEVIEAASPADREQLIKCLLSMSTSASRETLLAIVVAMPSLLLEPAFASFSEEVLYVLRVSHKDLWEIANHVHAKEHAENVRLQQDADISAAAAAAAAATPAAAASSGPAHAPSPAMPVATAASSSSSGASAPQENGASIDGGVTGGESIAAAAPAAVDVWASKPLSELFACHAVTDSERMLSLRWANVLAKAYCHALSAATPPPPPAGADSAAVPPPPASALAALQHPVGCMDLIGGIHVVAAMHASLVPSAGSLNHSHSFQPNSPVSATGASSTSKQQLQAGKKTDGTSPSSAAAGQLVGGMQARLPVHAGYETDPSSLCLLLSKCDGWPLKLSGCSDKHIRCLLELAVLDTNPKQQITTLFELCLQGSERCLDVIRRCAPQVKKHLIDLANQQAASAASGGSAAAAASALTFTNVDLMAAVMVFHEMATLQEFAQHCPPLVALKIGYNLTPRLTRSQWRPRHFHSTVTTLQQLVDEHPSEAWIVMDRVGLTFFLKELTKKRSQASEIRSKLEALEQSEKMLDASATQNRWALLTIKQMVLRQKELTALLTAQRARAVAARQAAGKPVPSFASLFAAGAVEGLGPASSSSSFSVPPAPPQTIPKLPSIRGAVGSTSQQLQQQHASTSSVAGSSTVAGTSPGPSTPPSIGTPTAARPTGGRGPLPLAEQLSRIEQRGVEIVRQRSELLSQTLQLLITVRLKPKQRPPPSDMQLLQSSQLRKKQPSSQGTPRSGVEGGGINQSSPLSSGQNGVPPPPPGHARPRSGRGMTPRATMHAPLGDSGDRLTLPPIS